MTYDPDRDEIEPERGYEPIHPRGTDWRGGLRRLFGPIVGVGIVLAKWSFLLLKFSSIFIAVAAYALIWGWKFAFGFVVLILVHELGHFIEANAKGCTRSCRSSSRSWAHTSATREATRGRPFASRSPGRSSVGPRRSSATSSPSRTRTRDNVWSALAYTGFFLNLINLIPFGPLDGGAVWRSAKWLRLAAAQPRDCLVRALLRARPLMLVLGMVASHCRRTTFDRRPSDPRSP